jgi:hypothetical protein
VAAPGLVGAGVPRVAVWLVRSLAALDDVPDVPSQELSYDAIGRVTAEGVLLEHSLKFLLVAIEFSLTLANYANAASLSQLIELCRVAVKTPALNRSQAAEATEILDRAEQLRLARNEIVHSLWHPDPADAGTVASLVGHRPTRRQLGMKVLPPRTVDDMRAIAAEIFQLREDMFVVTYNLLLARAGAAVEPLSRSSRITNPHGATADGRSITSDETADRQADDPPGSV